MTTKKSKKVYGTLKSIPTCVCTSEDLANLFNSKVSLKKTPTRNPDDLIFTTRVGSLESRKSNLVKTLELLMKNNNKNKVNIQRFLDKQTKK